MAAESIPRNKELGKQPKMPSPLRVIRTFCLECQGDMTNARYVKECKDTACPLYAYRYGTLPVPHRPLSAIKAYCYDYCQGGAGHAEVLHCQGDKAFGGPCPVFPFRLGVNPNISKATREKRRQAALLHDPLGLQKEKLSQIHVVSDAPEAPKTPQPILPPGVLGNDGNFVPQTAFQHGGEVRP